MKNQNGQDTAECSKMKKEGVLEAKWGEKGADHTKPGVPGQGAWTFSWGCWGAKEGP